MSEEKKIAEVKKAYDIAWAEAVKYADEAFEALKMHEQIQGRDTNGIFMQKAKRALIAHGSWREAAELARRVMDEYYQTIHSRILG